MIPADGLDLRHRVAATTMGSSVVMLDVQQCLDDIEGGLEAEQWGLLVFQTRVLVTACLHVCGLAHGAMPIADNDTLSSDPFHGVPVQDLTAGLALLNEACELPGPDPRDWFSRLEDFVRRSEESLGLADPLPKLKSPDGMFGALRLLRGWLPLAEELGLPNMLPAEWLAPS